MSAAWASLLAEELASRKQYNKSYSLRAFARDLKLNVTTLSEVLANKRRLSKHSALKIIDVLRLTPNQSEILLKETLRPRTSRTQKEMLQLREDEFKMIGDWYHLAILNLVKISSSKSSAEWIAKKLSITKSQATNAIARLQRLGFLELKDGKLVRNAMPLNTTNQIPSQTIRKYHKQNLDLARLSIDRDEIHLREFSSMVMAINRSRLPEAKKLIENFKHKLCDMLEKGNQPTEVYTLSIQLFPNSRDIE
jgi:uncharacterized protein (TIGR02147 family)